MDVLYNIIIHSALLAASPLLLLKMIRDSKFRQEMLDRFSTRQTAPRLPGALWIHASSVGEVRAARPLILEIKKQNPGLPICLSTFTRTGYELAKEENLVPVFRLPFDSPLWLNRIFRRLKPCLLVLIEAELWPGLLRQCQKRGVCAVLVNGRVSERSATRYLRLKPVFLWATQAVAIFSMRGEEDAKRLCEIGVDDARVEVTGNIKFDFPIGRTPVDSAGRGKPVLVLGSTRPGEEDILLPVLAQLKTRLPELSAVIAPRHLERLAEVEKLMGRYGLSYKKHSELAENAYPEGYILVDRLGELGGYYSRASVAFVGGSLLPGYGGHNIIEPAACRVPVVFGPHMENFKEEARLLIDAGGGIEVDGKEALLSTFERLLTQNEERDKRGQDAFETVQKNAGAVIRNIELINQHLAAAHATDPKEGFDD